MESILTDYLGQYGAFLGVLALLVLVVGGILMGRLAAKEETGERVFWAEWPLPESGEPGEDEALRGAA
jgi:hypothetical protein